MSEITQSSENSQIPEHWKFREKNNPDLKIVQIEPDANFLAIFSSDVPQGKSNIDKQYFFDQKGNVQHYRSKEPDWIKIGMTADALKSSYLIRSTGYSYIFFPDSWDKEEFPEFKSNSDIRYHNGELRTLRVDNLFVKNENYGIIKSPVFSIQKDKGKVQDSLRFTVDESIISTLDQFNEFRTRETDFHIKSLTRTDNSGSLDVFDWEEKKVFEINYGRKGDAMFITQTHIPTGIVKKISANIAPDWQAISNAVNAEPPYPYEKVGDMKHLLVPWREINRIIGAGILYSYPREQGGKR